MTTTTQEIAIVRDGWIVRASLGLARWARRRTVRRDIAEIYFGEEDERRARLEEQLLLDRERRAARIELDRTIAMSRLNAGL